MAYNKDNYRNNRLSSQQEKFVEGILEGKTQYQAYIDAYPRAKNWQRNSVDCNASQLMEDTKIKQRLLELGWREKKKIEWTRNKALETINYVMEMNKKDLERINEACQTEIDILEGKILTITSSITECKDLREVMRKTNEIRDITEQIAKLKKQKRTNGTNVHGIYEGAKILNRMFGLDVTKVEITSDDTSRNNIKQLSVEELKALAYANINKGDSEGG